jgi:uncharacterized protein (TIGR02147 family)
MRSEAISVFDCEDYRLFLKARAEQGSAQRGYKQRLARAASCQPSFLSQVFSLRADLSRDHAADIAPELGLDESEEEYFVLLVDLARASSPRLKDAIRRRLARLKKARLQPSARVAAKKMRDGSFNALYYSSWYWAAIHMLTFIPQDRTLPAIAQRLQLPAAVVERCLARLESEGLVARKGTEWVSSGDNVHLPTDSPFNEINHSHWRLKALADVQKKDPASIHYSSVFTVSRKDLDRLRELVISQLMQSRQLIVESPSEELCCLSVDLFRV